MGKELQMARSAPDGWSVLLAGPGARRVGPAPVRRAERAQVTPLIPKGKVSPSAPTPTKGKGDAATARGSREISRGKEYRARNLFGEPVGGLEGADTTSRRSAKVLGIKWFDSKCSKCPGAPHSHWLVEAFKVDGGGMFLCRYCHRARWLPDSLYTAEKFTAHTRKVGIEKAYWFLLDAHPAARKALEALRDIHLLDGTVEFGVALLAAQASHGRSREVLSDISSYRWPGIVSVRARAYSEAQEGSVQESLSEGIEVDISSESELQKKFRELHE